MFLSVEKGNFPMPKLPVSLYLMSCFAPNMNQAVLNLISKFSTECISLHYAIKQITHMTTRIVKLEMLY